MLFKIVQLGFILLAAAWKSINVTVALNNRAAFIKSNIKLKLEFVLQYAA